MDSSEHETQQGRPAEPGTLLAAYLDSGRKEPAFVLLVDRLAGLVFASAHRRTGDRALAEEISQNVFALLARKAGSLRSHPNLSAWVHRTTQLESAKAMRSAKRHQRKVDAFAREQDIPSVTPDESGAAWREAQVLPILDASLDQLPDKDRALVIQRFFERKRFAEIAGSTGKSEAACKMQVKRALEKLATLLRSRGVALSVPVIATGLTAEFAKAAPLASQALAAKALAASTGITTSTLLTNTLLTMSSAKFSALAAAAVVALCLFPLIRQHSEAARLRSEIATLEKPAVSGIPSRPSLRTAARDSGPARTTLRERLENDRQPVEVGPLLDDLMKVMMEQDIAGLIRVLTPVARMTQADYARLMEDLEAHDASPEAKSTALMILTSFAPETDFRERLESLIRQGATPTMLGEPLRLWAASDPDAALAWFETARAEGKILGKGVNSDPAPGIFAEILVALAGTQPDRALELAASMPRDEREKFRIDDKLAAAFAEASIQSGDTRMPFTDRAEWIVRNADAEEAGKKLDRVAETITRRVAELGDTDSGIGAFLRLLPALLPHVEPLDIDELIAVADRLGNNGALFPPTDDKSSARLVLYLLAAEQDPLKILSRNDLDLTSDEGDLQTSIFNTLARKDPDAAIRWLDAQAMDDGPKSSFQRGIALGLLAHDPRRGLDFILEHPAAIPSSGMGPIIAGIRIPDAARDDLIEALPDPRYAELRPTLSKMVLESGLATARVAELRDQTAALQLGDKQVASFLRNHSSQLIQRDPDAAASWMKDALPADQYPSLLSTAIRRWTERDFNAAATFLGTMERGPARDQSIHEFADVVASMEPPSAAKWALEIEDPSLRQSALREVAESWLSLDPGAARGWMEQHGIPAPDAAHPETESP
jgi:RNA polymerase sigma factor (sigma-70 family)